MARLSLVLVIAAALVATATASDYGDDGSHGGYRGDYSRGEWGEIDGLFKSTRREVRDLVEACYNFLVQCDVDTKLAIAWAIRSAEFLMQMWDKVLHHHHDFYVDFSSLGNVRNEAQRSVSWVGPYLEETEIYFPGILQSTYHPVGDVMYTVTGSLGGAPGHGSSLIDRIISGGSIGGGIGGSEGGYGSGIGGGYGSSYGGGSYGVGIGGYGIGGGGLGKGGFGNGGLGNGDLGKGGLTSGLDSGLGLGGRDGAGFGGSYGSSLGGTHGGGLIGVALIGTVTSGHSDGNEKGTKVAAGILR